MYPIKNICTLSELKKLEVINLCDGKRLGCVVDLEFDLFLGNITAILVPKKMGWQDWFRKGEKRTLRIPWSHIDKIGDDTILVRMDDCPC